MKSILSFLLLLLAAVAQAVSSGGSRLLAVLDDLAEKDTYSGFFEDLKSRGYDVSYATPKTDGLALFHLGERTADHVMFFPTRSKGLGPNLTAQILLQFINAEGNILLALSSSQLTPTSLVSLLLELDIHLPTDRTGLVVDHFNYDTSDAADQHDVLLLPPPAPVRPGIADLFGPAEPTDALLALPRTVGQTLGAGALLAPIVRAPRTAYSYNPKEQGEALTGDDLFAAGEQLSLVSAMQARNSARFAVLGSAEMLADKWFGATVKSPGAKTGVKTYNREFARRLSAWTFQELGVLRVNWIEHHLNEPGAANESNPKIYRVKNDVTYTISMSEYKFDKWTPFLVAPEDALQLEFSMLSPFHRLPLALVSDGSTAPTDAAVYSASFTVPDQHGIFNFMVNYKRPFLTNVVEKNTVTVRHMAHDEFPRSWAISGAWPWMTGIAVTVAGWLAFCAVWMFSQPTRQAGTTKKTQ